MVSIVLANELALTILSETFKCLYASNSKTFSSFALTSPISLTNGDLYVPTLLGLASWVKLCTDYFDAAFACSNAFLDACSTPDLLISGVP